MTESKNILEVFKSLAKKINFQKQKLEGEIDTLKGNKKVIFEKIDLLRLILGLGKVQLDTTYKLFLHGSQLLRNYFKVNTLIKNKNQETLQNMTIQSFNLKKEPFNNIYWVAKSLCKRIYKKDSKLKINSSLKVKYIDPNNHFKTSFKEYKFLYSSIEQDQVDSCQNYTIPLFYLLESENKTKTNKDLTIVFRGTSSGWDMLSDLDAVTYSVKELIKNVECQIPQITLNLKKDQYDKYNHDFLSNKSFSECYLHKRFFELSYIVFFLIENYLVSQNSSHGEYLNKYKNIYICGHSMGGALATILSLLIFIILDKHPSKVKTKIKVSVFNPGTIFVSNQPQLVTFKNYIKSKSNYKIYNFIYKQDPISRSNILELLLLYATCLKEQNKLITLESLGSKKKEFKSLKTVFFYIDSINDIYNLIDSEEYQVIKGFRGYGNFNKIVFYPGAVSDHLMGNFPGVSNWKEAEMFCDKWEPKKINCHQLDFQIDDQLYVCQNPSLISNCKALSGLGKNISMKKKYILKENNHHPSKKKKFKGPKVD